MSFHESNMKYFTFKADKHHERKSTSSSSASKRSAKKKAKQSRWSLEKACFYHNNKEVQKMIQSSFIANCLSWLNLSMPLNGISPVLDFMNLAHFTNLHMVVPIIVTACKLCQMIKIKITIIIIIGADAENELIKVRRNLFKKALEFVGSETADKSKSEKPRLERRQSVAVMQRFSSPGKQRHAKIQRFSSPGKPRHAARKSRQSPRRRHTSGQKQIKGKDTCYNKF